MDPRARKESYIFVLPALLFFGFYILYPIIDIFKMGFTEIVGNQSTFGIGNLSSLFKDPVFYICLKNFIYWSVLTIGIQAGLGLLLAILLDQPLLGNYIFRSIFFMPVVLSPVVITIVWSWGLYDPNFGFINSFLQKVGLGSLAKSWLGDPRIAIFSLILVNIWQWTGFSMMLYLAGLQDIPQEVYEAAKIDGASSWHTTFYITIPLLKPVHFTLLVLGIIGSLKTFEIVYLMTGGGPNHSTEMLATYIFQQAFLNNQYEYGASIAVILFLIAIGLTAVELVIYTGEESA